MEDLSYIDPNSPTLRQSLADFLRGMTKKEDWQQVGQGIQNTGKLIPSITESLARGAIAQVPAIAGDISSTLRQFAPDTMQNVFGNRVAPTTEEILQAVPRINPDYQGSSQHEIVGSLTAPALAKMLKMGAEATKGLKGGLSIAYHGTPHEIQGGFDLSKVGTGEGAQVYGHGIYFAESPEVANAYKVNAKSQKTPEGAATSYVKDYGSYKEALKGAKNRLNNMENHSPEQVEFQKQTIKALENKNYSGNLYKVDVPDEHIATMVDWDKPFKEQPKIVQDAFIQIHKNDEDLPLDFLIKGNATGGSLIQAIDKVKATELLNELGVKGIKYLDEGSRGKGKGTHNFVSFDPQTVKILEKNGKPTRKEAIKKQLDELK